jgi:hypothetical protein
VGSEERKKLEEVVNEMKSKTFKVPIIIDGQEIYSGEEGRQVMCGNHEGSVCEYRKTDALLMHKVILIIDLTNAGY